MTLYLLIGPNVDYSGNEDERGLELLAVFEEYYNRNYDITDIYDEDSFDCTNSDYTSCNNYQDSNCYTETLSVTQDKNLCCRGVYSCKKSTISVESGSNTHCMAGYSCISGTISGPSDSSIGENDATLECGREACQYSEVSNIDNVVAVGYRGLEGTTVSDSEFLGCFTTEGCVESELSDIKYVYGTGYQSLSSANLDNSNLSKFEVYLLGYDSGNSLDITCDNDILEECVIYCYNEETYNNLGTVNCDCKTVILTQETPGLVFFLLETDTNIYIYIITYNKHLEPTSMPTTSTTCTSFTGVNDASKSWSEANEYCASKFGTSLGTIRSEYSMILALLALKDVNVDASNAKFWIGLNNINNDNSYSWIDGSNNDYIYGDFGCIGLFASFVVLVLAVVC